MPETHIHIIACALDECDGRIILRGVVDFASLDELQVDAYQREVLPESKINDLIGVMISGGTLPDIELGMRGQEFEILPDGTVLLKDPVFIIDGLQRTTAGRQMLKRSKGVPRLGCVVHFSTTQEWEKARFLALNIRRSRLSVNVVLRNMRGDSPALDALWKLSETERTSPMFGRVCWQQRMQGAHLITAAQFLKVSGFINARLGPGRSTNSEELVASLNRTVENVGVDIFQNNVRRFFGVIDECWDLRRTTFKSGVVCLRTSFLRGLASAFVEHTDFWEENQLVVRRELIRKLATLNLADPYLIQLAGSSGLAWQGIAAAVVTHLNSGKRVENRLKRFDVSMSNADATEEEQDSEAA